ncbi:MAG: HlyD family efflux transporter periplasmic adaptor subunit [Planctomycetota bacterium]|nr:HlyD family efflux transporter periplasmic adaptor subunit [Planctomycetota bacterium]
MTQASTTNRGPRGWDRMVTQLAASPDLGTFHRGMLDLQCKIVAAEYGALWVAGPDNKPMLVDAWPAKLAEAGGEAPLMTLLSQAAASGFERQASHVLKAEPEANTTPGAELGAHVFVTVMRVEGNIAAVATVVAELRDAQILQSTAPLRELAAGLYEGFFAKQEVRRREQDVQRVRQAMALLAVSQEAEGFGGATLNMVNELARQLKCSRVCLGWIRGKGVRVVAMSDTEHLKRHSQDVALTELAMAECLDQQQPVAYPIPPESEPLLQQAVVHSHKRLVANAPGRHVLSLPLRQRDEWLGVLLLERTEAPFEPQTIQYIQLVSDVIAPHLDDRFTSDKPLPMHAWRSVEWAAKYLVGPRHIAWKLGALAALALVAYIIFGTWEYKVSAPCVFEAEARRITPAPFEGQLRKAPKRAGDHVAAGDVLAELDTYDLKLQLAEARARMQTAQLEYEQHQYGQDGKQAEAQQAKANIAQAKARVDLLEYQIDRAIIKSPIAGVVLSGNWHDKIGGMIKQGEPMFEVAPIEHLTAVMHVNELDIDQFDDKRSAPYEGKLATRGEPEHRFGFTIERVVPAATPVNNVNSFEVRARLLDTAPWLRPGMEGLAKVEVGSKPIWWILTHRISDTLRLWFWW